MESIPAYSHTEEDSHNLPDDVRSELIDFQGLKLQGATARKGDHESRKFGRE